MSLRSEDILNPNGLLWTLGIPAYVAAVPATSYLTPPGGVVQRLLGAILPSGQITDNARAIPALSALYVFVTFAASAAGSVAGQAMGRREGLDTNEPRKHQSDLTGLPLRLRSAHLNLLETIPSYALAASIAYTSAASSPSLVASPAQQHIINLLGFHVLAKVFVYVPAYLADVAGVRSVSHLLGVSSVIGVLWRVAGGRV